MSSERWDRLIVLIQNDKQSRCSFGVWYDVDKCLDKPLQNRVIGALLVFVFLLLVIYEIFLTCFGIWILEDKLL